MPRSGTQLERLIDATDQVSIDNVELSVRRSDRGVLSGSIELKPAFSLFCEASEEEPVFTIGLRIELEAPVCDVVTDIRALYRVSEGFGEDLDEPLLLEFANTIALRQLLPFHRQAIADLTQRVLGLPLLLPIIIVNQLTFSRKDGTDLPNQEPSLAVR